MADHSPITATPVRAPLPDIRKLSINGTTPFLSGTDILHDAVRAAHAMSLLLAMASEDAQLIDRQRRRESDPESAFGSSTHQLKSEGYQAIATLLALSEYGRDLSLIELSERRN